MNIDLVSVKQPDIIINERETKEKKRRRKDEKKK